MGLDPYNFFHGGKNWTEMETLMQGFTNWIDTCQIDKPWMLGEWGSVEDSNQTGRKAQWYRNTADYIESEPRLKAVVHFNSSPEHNWLYTTSPSAKEAFSGIANSEHFEQSC